MLKSETQNQMITFGKFGVFPVDGSGTIGDIFGGWQNSSAEAEKHLRWIIEHYGSKYVVLSKSEHEARAAQQIAEGKKFKTGHDLLMEKFDKWLKKNHLVRGSVAAASLGVSERDFKSFIKKGIFEPRYMPDHENLAGFAAGLRLTEDQRKQHLKECVLNAHQVAEGLGITQKEFTEIRRETNIAHSSDILGRTVANESGTIPLYSRGDIEKLREFGEKAIAKRPKVEELARPKKS